LDGHVVETHTVSEFGPCVIGAFLGTAWHSTLEGYQRDGLASIKDFPKISFGHFIISSWLHSFLSFQLRSLAGLDTGSGSSRFRYSDGRTP
jgi:hypothetical protein